MKLHPTGLLILFNAVLAVGLAALWITPSGQLRGTAWEAPAPVVPAAIAAAEELPPRAPADTSRFLAVLEQPLFSPSRRPPPPLPPTTATAVPEHDPLANIQLQGTYASDAGEGGIFARVDGKNQRVSTGSLLGGWLVKSVVGRDVTFVRGEQTRIVRLAPAKLGVAPPLATNTSPSAGSGAGGGKTASAGDSPAAAAAQADNPVLRLEQERQERERARLELRNARRAAAGFPPITN
jgi:hypothetical protein